MTNKMVVLTTCGSVAEARRIARALLKTRRAACVNILTAPVQSIYRWKGKVESAREFLLIIKTTKKQLAALQRTITELHSYDVPEILALPVAAGSTKYLAWIDESIGSARAANCIRNRILNVRCVLPEFARSDFRRWEFVGPGSSARPSVSGGYAGVVVDDKLG